MTNKQANILIRITWILSAAGIMAAILIPYLNKVLDTGHLRNYMPWLFPGLLHLSLLLQACLLTFMLYKKSRLGAILLLLVFLNDKLFMLISLHGFDTLYIVTWLFVNLLYSLVFIMGIWATFAHRHQATTALPDECSILKELKKLWRGKMPLGHSFWAYVGSGVVAAFVIPSLTLTLLPFVGVVASLAAVLVQYIYLPAACIGTWRSIESYQGKTMWSVLARIAIIAVALLIIVSLYGLYTLISGGGGGDSLAP